MSLVVQACDADCIAHLGAVSQPWEHIPGCYLLETECSCEEVEGVDGVDCAHPADMVFQDQQAITWAGPETGVIEDDNWGLAALSSPVPLQGPWPKTMAYSYDTTGAGVIAYQIDGTAGVIPQLAGRLTTFYTAHPSAGPNSHGTAVAAFLAGTRDGVAKGAMVRNAVATGDSGSGSLSQIISAFDAVIGDYAGRPEPALINVSIAGAASSNPLGAVITAARDAGLLIIAGAGNNGWDIGASPVWPAADPRVLTVGAMDVFEQRISISNWGAPVDLWAPGYDLNVDGWGVRSVFAGGTSFSSPHVAGIGARLLQGRIRLNAAGVDAFKAQIIAMGKPDRAAVPLGTTRTVAHIPGAPASNPPGVQLRVRIAA